MNLFFCQYVIQPKARIQIQVHTKVKVCTTVYTQYGLILKLGFQKKPNFFPFFLQLLKI